MRSTQWIVTGILTLNIAVFSGARAATFGQLSYSVPAGWTQDVGEKFVTFKPKNMPLGEIAFITMAKGSPLEGSFETWFGKITSTALQGYTIASRSSVEKSKDAKGVPLLGQAVVQKNASGEPLYLFYVAANPKGRVELLFFTASSLETFRKYQPGLTALSDSVNFNGNLVAQTQPSSATSNLPTLKAPKLTDLLAQGFDPDKQPISDEFRCYPEINTDKYQQPVFALQMLGGGQYRAPGGSGNYTLEQDGSLTKLYFKSGPLGGSGTSYLNWNRKHGQSITVNNFPLKNDKSVDLECYQRGAREALAQLEFKHKDPQPGKYACRSTDGKNADKGTLEVLGGRQYRYAGGSGKFQVNILGDQGDDYSDVEFFGGPLEDMNVSFEEDDKGEREFRFVNRFRCVTVVKPALEAQFGPEKAPAPPKGYGGIEGRWYEDRQQVGANFSMSFVTDFYFFNKNGYVFTDDPDTGLEDVDCSRTYPSGLPVCELYKVQGGQITIGREKPQPFKLEGGKLILDGEELDPILSVDNLRLEGEFKNTYVFSAVVGTGGGIYYNYLSFKKDGSFTRETDGGFSMGATTDGTSFGETTAVAGGSSSRSSSGKYSFKANTLTLTYGDGRVERIFAFLPPGENGKPDFKWLKLSDDNYFLEDPKKKK